MALAILVTTVGAEEDAQALARWAVGARLAACAQTSEIASVYRWEGKLQEEREFRLVFKTTAQLAPRLVEALAKRHPYDEPQLLTFGADAVSPGYLAWVEGALGS